MKNLDPLGWDAQWQEIADTYPQPDLALGRVAGLSRRVCQLLTAQGPTTAVTGTALVTAHHDPLARPVAGDWVLWEHRTDPPTVEAVLQRRTQIIRRAAGKRPQAQVLCANVDVVLVVTAAGLDVNPRRVERYLAAAWESGAQPVIVLNKSDLSLDLPAELQRLRDVAIGVPVVQVSAMTQDGMASLHPHLAPGRTVAFVGSSGVGKSTLVNRVLGSTHQATGEVRRGDEHGRHTTSGQELLVAPSGVLVIDTAGIREFGLWGADEGLSQVFADIEALAVTCRYRDCRHEGEPGCEVRTAIDQGHVASGRLEAFRLLTLEMEHTARRSAEGSRREQKRAERQLTQMHESAKQHRKQRED